MNNNTIKTKKCTYLFSYIDELTGCEKFIKSRAESEMHAHGNAIQRLVSRGIYVGAMLNFQGVIR